MSGGGPRAVSTADRLAYVDDCLARIDRGAIEERMRDDPELKGQIETWRAQNEAIRAAFPDHAGKRSGASWTVADWLMVPDLGRHSARRAPESADAGDKPRGAGPVGESLRKAVAPPDLTARPNRAGARILRGIVAALALWSGVVMLFSAAGPESPAKAATSAYRTYAEGRVRPVEAATGDRATLSKWFAAQMTGAATVPDLSEAGLALVGGRVVPGVVSAAAFALYESPRHERFAIEIESIDSPPETDFAIDVAGGILCASWTGAGHSYAIVGRASRARLVELARTVRDGM
jgi:anti-sigma factor RsiW